MNFTSITLTIHDYYSTELIDLCVNRTVMSSEDEFISDIKQMLKISLNSSLSSLAKELYTLNLKEITTVDRCKV